MHVLTEPRNSMPASDDQRHAIREACRMFGGAPKKWRDTPEPTHQIPPELLQGS